MHLKQVALIQDSQSFVYRVWQYSDAKEVLEFIRLNQYILFSIEVFKFEDGKIVFAWVPTWNYRGDRNKSRKENYEVNLVNAYQFLDRLNRIDNFLYRIYYESEPVLDKITREFLDKAILHSHEITFLAQDALDIIERRRELNNPILGLEAFLLEDRYIQPVDYMDYTSTYLHKSLYLSFMVD